jgi:hypothetical protein
MIIETLGTLLISWRDEKGDKKIVKLLPGRHNYNLDIGIPIVAEQLRVYRKHKVIRFDELLPSDMPILKKIPDGANKSKELTEKVILKPSPVKIRNKSDKSTNDVGATP